MATEQGSMQEYAKQFGQVVARAWDDEAFKGRLLAEPKAVLAQEGVPFPPEVEVRIHENTPTAVHLALPPRPIAGSSDAQADEASLALFGPWYRQLAARTWADPAFKARLLADPISVLAEQGIAYPPGVAVEVHENTPTTLHLALPPKPTDELSDEQLDTVAGGALSTAGTAFSVSSVGTCIATLSCMSTAGPS